VRHAVAVPQGTPGIPDASRPLTRDGERSFREAARGLARLLPRPDALLTSPLPRARRTAELAARAFGKLEPKDEPALASGDHDALAEALRAFPREACLGLFGHNPHVSTLLARLLGSPNGDPLLFRKGGAALVEVPDSDLRDGTLIWFLPPKVLRRLGRR